MEENLKTHQTCSRSIGGLLLSFFSLLLFTPVHAIEITWEDRGGEAIRLGAVTATASTPSGTDNKDQGAYAQNDLSKRNYAYDPQGNLISDKSEEIANIEWTASGKVRRITRTPQSGKPDLEFRYDASGNRVSKTVISKPSGERITTYYVRDAQGTTLATYTEKSGDLRLSEQHLYGAKRLGMRSSNLLVASTNSQNGDQNDNVGEKRYELTNHLGNVLAVVSDQKKEDDTAQILSLTDYYPFGMEMDGRKYVKYVADGGYRYGFNGQEKETAEGSSIDYGARVYDVRIGRWLSIDAYNSYYPSNSVYCHSICSPINFYDSNGFFVRNSNTGNIIFCIDAVFWLPSYDYENVFNGPFFAAYKGTILTNQGTKIEAFLSYDGKVYDKMPLIIENGKSKYNQNMKPIEGNSVYNCTGNAMAMQKLNIDNRIITEKILEEEGFKEIKESELQENDIVTYVKDGIIQHFELITVFINEDGTKELRCSGKGGYQNPSDYMDKPYGKNPNYKDCVVKFYSKQSPDFKAPLRILETKGGVDIVDPNVMKQLQNYVKNKNQQSEK